jgi:hypothetical protein
MPLWRSADEADSQARFVVRRALKIVAPAAVAVALLAAGVQGAFASDGIGLTNVAGAAGDCTSPVTNSACATLFTGGEPMWPGKQPEKATVTIAYHGHSQSQAFGLYLSKFESRSVKSGPYCTAPDPADKLNLTIRQGTEIVYQGTLSSFARDHHDTLTLLPLRGGHDGSGEVGRWANGDTSTFTISVGLDVSADNPYMTCVSTTDLAWLAA